MTEFVVLYLVRHTVISGIDIIPSYDWMQLIFIKNRWRQDKINFPEGTTQYQEDRYGQYLNSK